MRWKTHIVYIFAIKLWMDITLSLCFMWYVAWLNLWFYQCLTFITIRYIIFLMRIKNNIHISNKWPPALEDCSWGGLNMMVISVTSAGNSWSLQMVLLWSAWFLTQMSPAVRGEGVHLTWTTTQKTQEMVSEFASGVSTTVTLDHRPWNGKVMFP